MATEVPENLPVRPAVDAQRSPDAAAAPPDDAKARAKATPPDVLPEWLVERNRLFEELWQEHLEEIKSRAHTEIKVTLDIGDGNPSVISGEAYVTSPGSLLRTVPKDIAANVVISKVNGELWDLDRPLESDATVEMITFGNPVGREVFWHSAAHALGESCELELSAYLVSIVECNV